MKWADLPRLSPLKLNIGGRRDHHPRPRWRGFVAIDGSGGADGEWSVRHLMPNRFELPDDRVDAALSEHFIEHLRAEDAAEVMAEVRRVLRPGAMFRVAVPDILHPAKRDSLAAGRDLDNGRHLSIWSYDRMVAALAAAGFQRIDLMHYWDREGRFHQAPLDHRLGWVKRTPEHDKRNRPGAERHELWSTSLVVDAHKPSDGRSARLEANRVRWCPRWHGEEFEP